jgi:hypothetical protein
MMRLFFGWLLGVETVERPVVKEQLGTIALHWALHRGKGAGR